MNTASPPALTPRAAQLAAQLIRNWKDAPRERIQRAPLYDSMCAGLSGGTAAKKLGAAVDTLAPGMRVCPYHFHHAQEEMFVILDGVGSLRVDGELLPVRAGDVIFIPPGPEFPHQLINTSDADLTYLSISTQEKPEICEYPDSQKVAAFAPGQPAFIQRRQASLDYWEGES